MRYRVKILFCLSAVTVKVGLRLNALQRAMTSVPCSHSTTGSNWTDTLALADFRGRLKGVCGSSFGWFQIQSLSKEKSKKRLSCSLLFFLQRKHHKYSQVWDAWIINKCVQSSLLFKFSHALTFRLLWYLFFLTLSLSVLLFVFLVSPPVRD